MQGQAEYSRGIRQRRRTSCPKLIEMLRAYVDIFMPDFKYYDSEISEKYSAAKDYFSYASAAIGKMIEIAGKPVYDENGLMKSGVIIRHMVLPSHRKHSEKDTAHHCRNVPEGQLSA